MSTDTRPEGVELQYLPSYWASRATREKVLQTYDDVITKGSRECKNLIKCQLDIPYGSCEKERLDIFLPENLPEDCPIFVYIHGGCWQEGAREDSSFMAKTYTSRGCCVISLGYDLAPNVKVGAIVEQITKAMLYVIAFATKRKSKGVYLSGHSAGGHLAAMMLHQDWERHGVDITILKGLLLFSGVYDLRPLVLTTVNEPLKMDDTEAWSLSPIQYVDEISTAVLSIPVIVAVGEHESPEFVKQSENYNQALCARGVKSRFIKVMGVDHFNIVENLVDPDYDLNEVIFKAMGLTDMKAK